MGDGNTLLVLPSPSAIARLVVQNGIAPAAAAGCSIRTANGWRSELGGDSELLFDLASVTKPMTAVAFARVVASGLVHFETRLGDVCPELRRTASADAPLELLLAHRAGLAAHLPLFEPLVRGESVERASALERAADTRRAGALGPYPPHGFEPIYSDLGYALLGEGLARITDSVDAGHAIGRLVVLPLALEGRLGSARDLEARGVDMHARAAPTEWVDWRGGLVTGRVHDENAWVLTGVGASGHAGMFGTVEAVVRFGEAVLDGLEGRGPFAGADLARLVAERPNGTLRAGFDGKSANGSSAGVCFGPRSFGHLGFTGTSLWIDPDARIVAVLLTNRVSPSRDRLGIRDARPRAHDALHAYAVHRLVR